MLPRAYAALVVALRWVVVGAGRRPPWRRWSTCRRSGRAAATWSSSSPPDNPAVRSELRSFDKFGFPLLSRVAVVQRNPSGLPQQTQAKAVERAQAVSDGTYTDAGPILAAVPVMNTLGLFPGSPEDGTTIVTLLFTDPSVNFADQVAAAERFVADALRRRRRRRRHHRVGAGPGRAGADRAVVGAVAGADHRRGGVPHRRGRVPVARRARSWRSAVAGVATVLTLHVGGALALRLGVPVPQETQPLLVALLLGVVTDYVVFYLSAVRPAAGRRRRRGSAAARQATARFTPIIATAGATAAAGTGALIVAGSPAFRAFGPGMALAVLIGMVVAVTLVPALLAILGPAAFWSPLRAARGGAATVRRPSAGAAPRPLVGAAADPALVRRCPCCCCASAGLVVAALPLRHIGSACRSSRRCRRTSPPGPPRPRPRPGSPTASCRRPSCWSRATAWPAARPSWPAAAGPRPRARRRRACSARPRPYLPKGSTSSAPRDGAAARYLLVLADEPLGARAVQTP